MPLKMTDRTRFRSVCIKENHLQSFSLQKDLASLIRQSKKGGYLSEKGLIRCVTLINQENGKLCDKKILVSVNDYSKKKKLMTVNFPFLLRWG